MSMLPALLNRRTRKPGVQPLQQQMLAQAVRNRCDVSEFAKCEIGREAYPPHNHSGTVPVAIASLAFYAIIGATHVFMAPAN
jgi:hypothetical protein